MKKPLRCVVAGENNQSIGDTMKNIYELSWTEYTSKDELVTRLDETILELDMLRLRYKCVKNEADMYQQLYWDALTKLSVAV